MEQPEQAKDPEVSAKILATFISSKKTAIATALAANDLVPSLSAGS